MAENTKIEWTTHTFNPWIGCQVVSPGCDNCYAETLSNRRGWTQWGPEGERVRTKPATWKQPLTWDRKARAAGERHKVFCASLADVFDNQAPTEPTDAREDLFELIRQTPNLDWQLLTKRPQNFARFLPEDWGETGYPNVWLGVSAENQEEYDRRWRLLAETPAAVRFISYEPALGPVSLRGFNQHPDWLIWGGESGPGCRPMQAQWARDITRECVELEIPVFGKQWGSYNSNPLVTEQQYSLSQAELHDPRTNGKGGALLDGRLWRQFPLSAGLLLGQTGRQREKHEP